METLLAFAINNQDCTVSIRLQPYPKDRVYYVLEILYIDMNKNWALIKAGSYNLDAAIKELLEAWNNRSYPSIGII